MMCNKCGSQNITSAYRCFDCGNDCQPERQTTSANPTYFDTIFYTDYPTFKATRKVIGHVVRLP